MCGIMSLSPAGFLEGGDTPFTVNKVLLGPGSYYQLHTGYTCSSLLSPGRGGGVIPGLMASMDRFSGDLPLSLGPELASSASVQSPYTHSLGQP